MRKAESFVDEGAMMKQDGASPLHTMASSSHATLSNATSSYATLSYATSSLSRGRYIPAWRQQQQRVAGAAIEASTAATPTVDQSQQQRQRNEERAILAHNAQRLLKSLLPLQPFRPTSMRNKRTAAAAAANLASSSSVTSADSSSRRLLQLESDTMTKDTTANHAQNLVEERAMQCAAAPPPPSGGFGPEKDTAEKIASGWTFNNKTAATVAPTDAKTISGKDVDRAAVGGDATRLTMHDIQQAPFSSYCTIVIAAQNYVCSAALIHRDWIVTAAHCVACMTADPSAINVVFNNNLFGNVLNPSAANSRRVSRVLIHPLYNDSTLQNDIAILRLVGTGTAPPPFPANPALLPNETTTVDDEEPCIIVGFGTMDGESSILNAPLRRAPPPPRPNSKDDDMLLKIRTINVNNPALAYIKDDIDTDCMLIAGNVSDRAAVVGTCFGDDGVPLFRRSDNALIGLSSWGMSCDQVGRPGVFTNVASFADQLRTIVNHNLTTWPKAPNLTEE